MDIGYFLRRRTQFIRFYYEEAVKPFDATKHAIENELPPFNDPPLNEGPEPAFLEEWMEADEAIHILGLSCVSLLSDTLKLYFHSLLHRVIGLQLSQDKRPALRHGILNAYLPVLREILGTDWSDCPAELAVIEQITLARNRSQHGSDLAFLRARHDKATLKKHPRPFFADARELADWNTKEESISSFWNPLIDVSREKLISALDEVEKLVAFIESRYDKISEWRTKKRNE